MQKCIFLLLVLVTGSSLYAQQWKGLRQSTLSKAVLSISKTADSSKSRQFLLSVTDVRKAESLLVSKKMESRIRGKFYPSRVLLVELPLTEIADIFRGQELIRFIEVHRQPKEETHINGYDRTANGLNSMKAFFPALNGSGITISVKERRFDSADIDLRGRVKLTGIESETITTHASQMATMIAGGGNSSDYSFGAAWGATVSSSSFETLLPDPIALYEQTSTSIQNHSYGTGIENFYGSDAVAYDASVEALPYLLHVFSAGNSGDGTSDSGPYAGVAGYANITGSLKMAKNIVTVGATDSMGVIESRSSRGPAYDGRIKPDLVAYGHDGTSGAAAIVSGIAATLQHAYYQKESRLPDASLIRAILLNTADDKGNTGPDFQYGFGSANGLHALQAINAGWYFEGQVDNNQTVQHSISLPSNVSKLNVILTWSDPAAEVNAPAALINNLDLRVATPRGEIVEPWLLNSNQAQLSEPATRGRDSMNNVEQITITDPIPGMYTISVNARFTTNGGQKYAVAYYYELKNEFTWGFPAPGDQLQYGTRNLLRWDTDLESAGMLSVSVDSGTTWQAINQISNLSTGVFAWYPDPGYRTAMLKMDSEGKTYFSPRFQLSYPLNPDVILNCADSALISWNPIPGVKDYQIYSLQGSYLKPAFTTSDTSYVLNKLYGSFFALAPAIDDTTGLRSFAINVNNQGVGCYSNNLLADLQPNGDVNIQFESGTVYLVTYISLEKSKGGSFTEITRVEDPDKLKYEWVDRESEQGLSYYRVKIVLDSGQEIYSVVVQVTNPKGNDFLFFPNPVPAGKPLAILSANTDDAELYIHDLYGRLLIRKILFHQVETIQIYQPGFYFYQIRVAGKRVKSGKLVVK